MNIKKLKDGTHHFLKPGMRTRINKTRVENGTHNFIGGDLQRKLCNERVENGTHPWLGGEISRKINKKTLEYGTHNWLEKDYQSKLAKKRVENGTHNFQGIVNCIDRDGNKVKIKKEIYNTQDKNDMEFVFHRSNEAKKRLNRSRHQRSHKKNTIIHI